MNKNSYSSIGHRDLLLCNPLNSAKVDKVVDLLKLTPEQSVVDYGAGKAEFLIRLITRYGVKATAVELEGGYISEATQAAEGRIPLEKLDMVIGDAKEHAALNSGRGYDLSVCMGSTHAFGGFPETLDALMKVSKPHGYVLVAELYWKRRPEPDFLGYLQMQEEDLGTYDDCIARAEQNGLIPL